jgi:hypothetical protein
MAMPALSGPRHASAWSIVKTICPETASYRPVLSQKATIPHMRILSAEIHSAENPILLAWTVFVANNCV